MHYQQPEYGYRKIYAELRKENFMVNEKKIERLWHQLGFSAILPRRNLSKPDSKHPRYPYLLNELWIGAPNQVFNTEITFLPLANGFIYLVTIADWYSRFVKARELSNTMTVDFCLAALEKALKIANPEYFNIDQGSQFTSSAFIKFLEQRGIKISMDGKGRCIWQCLSGKSLVVIKVWKNLFTSLWDSKPELCREVDEYIEHFNYKRPHQSLLYATPYEIYLRIKPKFSKGDYKGFKVKEAKIWKEKTLKIYEDKKKSNPIPILRRAIEKLLGSGSDCSLVQRTVFTIGEKKRIAKKIKLKVIRITYCCKCKFATNTREKSLI